MTEMISAEGEIREFRIHAVDPGKDMRPVGRVRGGDRSPGFGNHRTPRVFPHLPIVKRLASRMPRARRCELVQRQVRNVTVVGPAAARLQSMARCS